MTDAKSPVNELPAETLNLILSHLPIELTFTDEHDIIRFYTENKNPIFEKSPDIVGTSVVDCHTSSKAIVQQLLDDFRSGKRSAFLATSVVSGRVILERYIAVRNEAGNYVGTLEIVQDIGSAEE